MTLLFIRVLFFFLGGIIGFQIGSIYEVHMHGFAYGCLGATALIALEAAMKRVSMRGLSSMVFGLILGVLMANIISDILSLIPLGDIFHSISRVLLTLIFAYLGSVMALRGKDEFNIIIPYVRFKRMDDKEGVVLLDTSAIIDGRVSDIYKTHFLVGRLVVPRFVLHELQKLADSEDDVKRQRGRRGMELLRTMQGDEKVDVHVHEDDFADGGEVDLKLIRLAKLLDARICTTDFNLGRMATIQGLEILNVNELVNAAKPAVYAGEEFEIQLIKAGKEDNQAVGYLEDGTMVVVSDGKNLINHKVGVKVTSVLQTQAGRMIFASVVNQS